MLVRRLLLRNSRSIVTPTRLRPSQRFFSAEISSEPSLGNGQQDGRLITPANAALTEFDAQSMSMSSDNNQDWNESVVANWNAFKHQQEVTGYLGSIVASQYEPAELLRNPPSPADVTLELLLASQAHLGHKTTLWNPGNAQYIYGIRDGIHIISLEVTASHLRRAAKVVEGVAMRGGLILFVGTRKGQDSAVVRAAQLAGGCHLFQRWIPGSITNGQQILGSCATKVVDEKDAEISGFDEQLKQRATLKPDLVICLDPMQNYVLLNECAINNIPTIGVIDTNADPTWVTYPIPANDDSIRCIQVIAGVLGRAGEAGKNARLEAAAQNVITYAPAQGLRWRERKTGTAPAGNQRLVPDIERYSSAETMPES